MDDERRQAAPRIIGKVIKGDTAVENPGERSVPRAPRAGMMNAEEFEARTTAQRILEEARQKAQELLDEAKANIEQVKEEAREEARAQVQAEALAELAKAKMQAGQMLADAEPEIVALACKVAERIIGRDLERQPELVAEICATAVETVRQAKAMVLRVNPRDAKILRESKTRLMELLGRTLDLGFKDDPDVEAGGCIIQTEFGTVDAQLKTQFEMLRLALAPDTVKKESK